MLYSAYDEKIGRFRYYNGSEIGASSVPKMHPYLGTAAEDATPALPLDAGEIGTGEQAVGRIAKPGMNLSELFKWGIRALAVYGAYRLLTR
jgi:hypothetical protein